MSLKTDRQTGYPSVDKPWIKLYSREAFDADIPDASMYDFIKQKNASRLTNVAMNYFGNQITYSDFFENVEKVAGCLAGKGIQKGDIVSIISLNTPETTYLVYALNYIGAISNLIIATSSPKEIISQVYNTGSKLLIVLDKLMDRYASLDVSIPIVILPTGKSANRITSLVMRLTSKNYKNCTLYSDFLRVAHAEFVPNNEPDAPAMIIYTSGSTGTPKGVVLSSRNLNAVACMCILSGKGYKVGEKFLNILPPFYSFGIGMMHLCFCTGVIEIICLVPKTAMIIKMLKKYKPERFVIGPAITDVIEKNPMKDLSFVVEMTGGGGSITLEKEQRINTLLQEKNARSIYLSGYGMTELASAVSMNHNDRHRCQSIGLPLPYVNMKVVDQETGHELSYNEEGEILVSSPGLMLEYYKNPAATEEAIDIVDGVRWLHTGDIGRIDEEGYVYITGRVKRIYITKDESGMAYKLFPLRLEEVIEEYDGIERCAVVIKSDEEKQNVPVVFVVSKMSQSQTENLISTVIRQQLPAYYHPEKIIVLDQIPVNANQKIDYSALEKRIY